MGGLIPVNRLKGRSAVITGGGGGIGREVALAFAAEGANVLIADYGSSRIGDGFDTAPAEKVAAEIMTKGGSAIAHFANVTEFKAAEDIVKNCVNRFGSIDILVNCAGIAREQVIWKLSEDDWDKVIAVHLKGTFNCIRHTAPIMREQKYGRIINITADAWLGVFGHSNYSASKGGIVSLTRSVALELGKYGITANAIAPLARTKMTATTEEGKANARKAYESGFISKELYENIINMPGPEYLAPLFVYLASSEAANINGQVFHSTKGKIAIYSEPVEVKTIYKTDADGMWTLDDLIKYVPDKLLKGYRNPAPPQANKD
jgi:NAD(P)-dependent dehydrogenase (short-subunit alcohol dehydrogenase family)